MTTDSSSTVIIDEIDRLCVTYDKAKEFLSKITSNIEQQMDLWQYRRQIILDQLIQMKSSSSCDFLLPKTQRINELTIEAVEALCRVDLLFEQILRIDPKSRVLPTSTSFSTRSVDTNVSSSSHVRQPIPSLVKPQQQQPPSMSNGQHTFPIPVIRNQPQTSSGRLSTLMSQEKTGFKPVISQQSSMNTFDNSLRSTPMQSQNNSQHSTIEGLHFPRRAPSSYSTRTSQSDHLPSPLTAPSTNQTVSSYPPRQHILPSKEKIKLQRIPPGTKWLQARIEIIDSLSGFYVENHDPKVRDKFVQMEQELHDYYDELEKSNQLTPLQNIAIGDFGVAKYSGDDRWYRARLITCEGQNVIKIVFVDFGNIEIKSMNNFYPLHKLFTDLPAQAIACSLAEAFPRSPDNNEPIWPEETIQIFRKEVTEKDLEVYFVPREEGTEQWPLHFVKVMVSNQSLITSHTLRQRIELRPNHYIAEQMAPFLNQQEYILFNVPISEDDVEQ